MAFIDRILQQRKMLKNLQHKVLSFVAEFQYTTPKYKTDKGNNIALCTYHDSYTPLIEVEEVWRGDYISEEVAVDDGEHFISTDKVLTTPRQGSPPNASFDTLIVQFCLPKHTCV